MNKPVSPRKSSIFSTIKAVTWAFVGLRARGDPEKEAEQINPVHIVIVALVGVLVFVGSLIFLVTWVVGK